MTNTIFRGGDPTRLNACVGNNGSIDYFEYANGFSLAAKALLDIVIQEKGVQSSPDYLIYPICFNMRHSIELRLKGAIEELVKVAKSVNKTLEHDKYSISSQEERVNIIYVHNINAIWDFFKKNALELDERFKYLVLDLEHHITDIASIDPTGQTFRYPISKTSKKHLIEVGGLINCQVLKTEFDKLHDNLEKLFYFTKDILEEYQLSSIKDGISRVTLNFIALSFKSIKSAEDYKNTKILVRRKFNLSSRKLEAAIERIKLHYEFAHIVNEPITLLGITEPQLIKVIEYWVTQNPKIYDAPKVGLIVIDSKDFDFSEIMSERQDKLTMLDELKDDLSAEFSAGLSALFYFSSNGIDYSEYYYDIYIRELKSQDTSESFLHVFDKAILLEMILVSLVYLGFRELAERIIALFDLQNSYLNISEIRERSSYCRKSLIGEYTQKYIDEYLATQT